MASSNLGISCADECALCGEQLVVTVPAIYGTGHIVVICDSCGKDCDSIIYHCSCGKDYDSVIYHCSKGQSPQHFAGFDLCDTCYSFKHLSVDPQLLHCSQIERIKQCLKAYHINDPSKHINVDQILDDYIYLIHKTINNDNNFEYIYDYIGLECPLKDCRIFQRRSNKNMTYEQKYDYDDVKYKIIIDIIDKIHCFLLHSYDTGHRLRAADVNKAKDKTEKINNRYSKYNALKPYVSKHKNYHYGIELEYQYNDDELTLFSSAGYKQSNRATQVNILHNTPKQELLSTQHLNIQQWNSEYAKAALHFNSQYCKATYRPYTDIGHIKLEYILVVMFYTNFDGLQYAFSRTFREDIKDFRIEYYWFGKYLKIAVNVFGQRGWMNMKPVYHGINE
eukprot:506424_1